MNAALALIRGLYCNISMYFFVKKTNSNPNKGTNLVPWKSSNVNQDEDLQIPTRATIVALVMTLVVCGLTGFFISLIYSDNTDPQVYTWAILFNNFCASLLPVVLVLFTIKGQSKIQKIQPPQGLQFHGSDAEANPNEDQNIQPPQGLQFHETDAEANPNEDQNIQPPQGLQFHGIPNEDQNIDEK